LKDLFYGISEEEQRARIQATWSLCQNVINNKNFMVQFVAQYNINQAEKYRYPDLIAGSHNNFRTEIVSLMKSYPFKYVHFLGTFQKLVNTFQLDVSKKTDNYAIALVLGYFMFKHNYIKASISSNKIERFFSTYNIISKLKNGYSEDDDNMCRIVQDAVYKNYRKYQNIIYNTIGLNVEKIFNYTSASNNSIVHFNKLASDSDLKLKLYEVELINESYNYYVDNKNRWLKGSLVM
jgi:hypothetical protein